MKNPLSSFGFRVTLAIILSMLTLVIVSNSMIYRFVIKAESENLRTYLRTIAQTAASLINTTYLNDIPLSPEGVDSKAYKIISKQLKSIKDANKKIKYIYIMTKTEDQKAWKFIVDIDRPGSMAMPGSNYDASRFSQLVKAYEGATADLKVEEDEWGKSLSGYAPILDQEGKAIAVLGVDMDSTDVFALENVIAHKMRIFLAIGIVIALILGFLISSRVLGPIKNLRRGIEYIKEGNLHHKVKVIGDDEIANLAKDFNEMAGGLYESREKLLNYFYDSVKALVMLLEARDHYTLGHSESVARYSEMIAMRMGIDAKRVEFFKRVVLLHDIGKVGVRDNILLKTGKLTEQEWEVVKLHPSLGEQIIKPILKDSIMLAVIRNHHERYDGKGYPDGLAKDQIPLLVSIVTVADSFDAMVSTRSYREAMTRDQAIQQLIQNRGTQFHPDVVDHFLAILDEESNKDNRKAFSF